MKKFITRMDWLSKTLGSIALGTVLCTTIILATATISYAVVKPPMPMPTNCADGMKIHLDCIMKSEDGPPNPNKSICDNNYKKNYYGCPGTRPN